MEELISTLRDRRKGILYLLKMISPRAWDYKPHPTCRSTAELANHLASSPLMLLKLFKGEINSADDFNTQEKKNQPSDAEGLVILYESSLNNLISYLEKHLVEAKTENISFFYKEKKTSLYH